MERQTCRDRVRMRQTDRQTYRETRRSRVDD